MAGGRRLRRFRDDGDGDGVCEQTATLNTRVVSRDNCTENNDMLIMLQQQDEQQHNESEDQNSASSSHATPDERRPRVSNRPALQIYRPPGRRQTSDEPTADATSSSNNINNNNNKSTTASSNPQRSAATAFTPSSQRESEHINLGDVKDRAISGPEIVEKSPAVTNGSGEAVLRRPKPRRADTTDNRNAPADGKKTTATASSSADSTSVVSQKSSSASGGADGGGGGGGRTNGRGGGGVGNKAATQPSVGMLPQSAVVMRRDAATTLGKPSSTISEAVGRRSLRPQSMLVLPSFNPSQTSALLSALDFRLPETVVLRMLQESQFADESSAHTLGQAIAQRALDAPRVPAKQAAQATAAAALSPSSAALLDGVHTALSQYWDCRHRLRIEHTPVWIALLSFVSELVVALGPLYDGPLVDLLFAYFSFCLTDPILETLRIDELEALLATLLSTGYDLERRSPDRTAQLRSEVRDALLEAREPWARKMLLLLLELAASGWKLPLAASEYYFTSGGGSNSSSHHAI